MIGFIILASSGMLIAGLSPDPIYIGVGEFVLMFFIPIIQALLQATFQTKVAPEVQGRVFAIRGMIAQAIMPLAYILSGPLADNVFEPLMAEGGALASTFVGSALGTGPGRGIGLMFILSCLTMTAGSILAYAHPRIRNLEEEIPDAIPDEDEGEEETSTN